MSRHPSVILTTDRLTLAPHRAADLDDCCAMRADAEVTRYLGGRPETREEVWRRLLAFRGHWDWLGFGYWVVRERATGRFVGEVGFADFQRGIDPRFEGVGEAGWVLCAAAQGRGLAGEAVAAALGWGDRHLPGEHTVCMMATGNDRSRRLAERMGYRVYRTADYRGTPGLLLQRPRPDAGAVGPG